MAEGHMDCSASLLDIASLPQTSKVCLLNHTLQLFIVCNRVIVQVHGHTEYAMNTLH